jgi:hypothetical protein
MDNFTLTIVIMATLLAISIETYEYFNKQNNLKKNND